MMTPPPPLRAGSPRALGAGLLLALLSAGCASLPSPPGRRTSLRYTPREATGPRVEPSRSLASTPQAETPERSHRRRASALAASLAFRGALREVSDSTRRFSSELVRLEASVQGLARAGVFLRYAGYGAAQGLGVGPNGVMMGTRVVVSAEWVEWVRHLVRAGVLSLPVVSAAVRIQAGQVILEAGAHVAR